MVIYETLLIIGGLGLAVMTLLGLAHVGHTGGHSHGTGPALDARHGGPLQAGHGTHAGGAAAHGHGTHAGGAAAHGHSGHGHAAPAPRCPAPGMRGWGANLLFELLSPLTLFSMALGAGATGLILQSLGLTLVQVAIAAALGAAVFYLAILRPLRSLIFSFASRPAELLDGALMQEAEVVTSFNAHGEGIVRLNVDGRSVDVLARLEKAEHGAHVHRGQRVLVEDVDTHRNEVRVSRL